MAEESPLASIRRTIQDLFDMRVRSASNMATRLRSGIQQATTRIRTRGLGMRIRQRGVIPRGGMQTPPPQLPPPIIPAAEPQPRRASRFQVED